MNPLTRLARWLGRYEWLMKLAPVIIRLDAWLHKVSGGRLSLVRLAGMPSLRLVTVGRRTGLPRANDLLYTPYGSDYVVIGSGWGKPNHPAWTLNLMAEPEATVVVKGRSVPVVARQVHGSELVEIWDLALRNWPAYTMEHRLSGNREFRVFVLTERD